MSPNVNKADASQVLKLESEPALRVDVRSRSAGVYTLIAGTGTISGTTTYVVDSGNNFTDEKGNLWRIQQFKKDAKEQVSLQIGK